MQKESRQVTSFPSLFGDITGLEAFFNSLIVFVIGGLQTKMYFFSQLHTYFRYNYERENERPGASIDVEKSRTRFTKLNMSLLDKLRFALLFDFCLSKRDLRKRQAFESSFAKL